MKRFMKNIKKTKHITKYKIYRISLNECRHSEKNCSISYENKEAIRAHNFIKWIS